MAEGARKSLIGRKTEVGKGMFEKIFYHLWRKK